MERDQPGFGCCVVCQSWRGNIGAHRRNIENVPVVFLNHDREEFLCEEKWCQQVRSQSDTIVAVCTLSYSPAARKAGIVDYVRVSEDLSAL